MLELMFPPLPTLQLIANPHLPLLQATLFRGTLVGVWTMPRFGAWLLNWDLNRALTPLGLGTAMAP